MSRTQASRKQEWVDYGALDRWTRDRIASLFDVAAPNPRQKEILMLADIKITLGDIPAEAYPGIDDELRLLVWDEFGYPQNQ